MNALNRNWLLRVYSKSNRVIDKLRIMDRSEGEAENEATSFVNNVHYEKDWTLTPLVLREDAVQRCIADTKDSYDQAPELLDDFIRTGKTPWGGGINKLSNKRLEEEYISRFAYENVAIVDDYSKIPEL